MLSEDPNTHLLMALYEFVQLASPVESLLLATSTSTPELHR